MKTPALTYLAAAKACGVSAAKFGFACKQLAVTPCRVDTWRKQPVYSVADVERVREYLQAPEFIRSTQTPRR